MKKVQYGIWNSEEGFWILFDTIEDAVSAEGTSDVYRLEAKLLGRFARAVKTIRIKRRKKKK